MLDVPEANKVVARGRGKDRRGDGVEYDLADLAARSLAMTTTSSGATYRPPAFSRPSGDKSVGCHPSSPQPSNSESSMFQIKTNGRQDQHGTARVEESLLFPSSPADTTRRSSKGDQAVSRLSSCDQLTATQSARTSSNLHSSSVPSSEREHIREFGREASRLGRRKVVDQGENSKSLSERDVNACVLHRPRSSATYSTT